MKALTDKQLRRLIRGVRERHPHARLYWLDSGSKPWIIVEPLHYSAGGSGGSSYAPISRCRVLSPAQATSDLAWQTVP